MAVIKASKKNRKAVAGRSRAGERYEDEARGTLLYQRATVDSLRASVGYAAVSESAVTYSLVTAMSD
jgi:hypothetical protein